MIVGGRLSLQWHRAVAEMWKPDLMYRGLGIPRSSSKKKQKEDKKYKEYLKHRECMKQIQQIRGQQRKFEEFEFIEHESEKGTGEITADVSIPCPKQIFDFLNNRVIGQDKAKRVLSSAVYYHYKRIQHNLKREEQHVLYRPAATDLFQSTTLSIGQRIARLNTVNNTEEKGTQENLRSIPSSILGIPGVDEARCTVLEKSNIILLGPTGSGMTKGFTREKDTWAKEIYKERQTEEVIQRKTLLANAVAEFLNVPFYVGDCTSLTIPGYVGEDVETMIAGLLNCADNDVEKCQGGIIFLDEIDKLRKTFSSQSDRDVGGEGVQQRLLKVLEGTAVRIPDKRGMPSSYKTIDTTNILFVGSGAFTGLEKIIRNRTNKKVYGFEQHAEEPSDVDSLMADVEPKDIIKFGMIPEFAGRMPVLVPFHGLGIEALLKILTEPTNAVVEQYKTRFRTEHCDLVIHSEALRAIAESAFKKNVGARGLRSLLENLLEEALFEVPNSNIHTVVITEQVVLGQESPYYCRR